MPSQPSGAPSIARFSSIMRTRVRASTHRDAILAGGAGPLRGIGPRPFTRRQVRPRYMKERRRRTGSASMGAAAPGHDVCDDGAIEPGRPTGVAVVLRVHGGALLPSFLRSAESTTVETRRRSTSMHRRAVSRRAMCRHWRWRHRRRRGVPALYCLEPAWWHKCCVVRLNIAANCAQMCRERKEPPGSSKFSVRKGKVSESREPQEARWS